MGPDANEDADDVPVTAKPEVQGVPPEAAPYCCRRQRNASQPTGDSTAKRSALSIRVKNERGTRFLKCVFLHQRTFKKVSKNHLSLSCEHLNLYHQNVI